MTWYAVFEAGSSPSNSEPVSTGTVIDEDHLREQGRTWIVISQDPADSVWDMGSQSYVDRPAVATSCSKLQFMQRWKPDEFIAFKAATDPTIVFFLYQIEHSDTVVPSSDFVREALSRCVFLGLLTQERAATIGAD